ncbi:hypothetical protein EV363DRAFT_143471 [Boletus edulis]|nr:hypothetical protein EV363DRAFT_143471 [Boletus edulis]
MTLLNVGQIAVFRSLSLCLGVLCAAPIVDLGYTRYQGAVDAELNVTRFLGARYAAAPRKFAMGPTSGSADDIWRTTRNLGA